MEDSLSFGPLAALDHSYEEHAVCHIFVAFIGGAVDKTFNHVLENSAAFARVLTFVSDNLEYVVRLSKVRFYLSAVKSLLCLVDTPSCYIYGFTSSVSDQIDAIVNCRYVVPQGEFLFTAFRLDFELFLHQLVKLDLKSFEQ